jgi:hypothetical protein
MGRMMTGKMRWALAVVVLAMVAAAAAWWALPRLPGRVRHYLPAPLAALVTTPLPTALPAPTGAADAAELALLAAIPTVAIPTATAPATAIAPAPAATAPPSPLEPQNAPLATPPAETTPPPLATRPPPPATLPPYGRVADIPIIPQKFNNCGPTNLTLVLNHYGVAVNQLDVAAVIRPNYEDRNVSPDELVRYVNDHTRLAAAAYVGGDVDTVRVLLAAGFPVIIEKGLEPDAATGWMGHYLTVFAYDDITRHFSVRDTYLGPWQGEGLVAYDATVRDWAHFNGAFVVVYPPERAADVAHALGPTFADAGAMWARAAERARTAVGQRPDDPFAWFNLGASLTALAKQGDAALYEAAAAAFDEARRLGLPARMLWYQFAPYEAYLAVGRHADVLTLAEATLGNQGGQNVEETYYYQGLALWAAGDEVGAQAALARAAELNPDSPIGQAARDGS